MTKDTKIALFIGSAAVAVCAPFLLAPVACDSTTAKVSGVTFTDESLTNKPYSLVVEEVKSYPGITPPLRAYHLSLVFTSNPTRKDAYEALVTELEKISGRIIAMHEQGGTNIECSAFIYVGDKQVRDTEGKRHDFNPFLAAHFDPKKQIIYRIPQMYQTEILKDLKTSR